MFITICRLFEFWSKVQSQCWDVLTRSISCYPLGGRSNPSNNINEGLSIQSKQIVVNMHRTNAFWVNGIDCNASLHCILWFYNICIKVHINQYMAYWRYIDIIFDVFNSELNEFKLLSHVLLILDYKCDLSVMNSNHSTYLLCKDRMIMLLLYTSF